MSSIDINKYAPMREGEFPVFKSPENRCVHVGNNPARNHVRQFKVDGGVLTAASTEQRCDYLLLNDTEGRSYYIELKGSDLLKAIAQVENTIRLISPSIKEYDIFRRIVYYTGSHKTQDSTVVKWKLKHGGKVLIQARPTEKVLIQSRKIEEPI